MRTKSYKSRVQKVVDAARGEIGYRARAQRVNVYGARIGQDGQPWAGSFLEVVFRAVGERGLPAMTSTTAALSEFSRLNQLHRKPLPGDIVFYAFSTDGPFSQPHVGLVTEVGQYESDGIFRAVEGQTDSGLPKGPQEFDGVYERIRRNTEVLAFARPKYADHTYTENGESTAPIVRPAQFLPGKSAKAVIYLQQALHVTVGARGMERGKFDRTTRAAVASFQRHIGMIQTADGIPDETTLRRLALETDHRFFRVRTDD